MTANKNDNANAPAPGDRRVKWILLLASAATLAMLVGAFVRENFLSEWRYRQRQFISLLEASDNPKLNELAESTPIELRQVDLPQFNTRDRCVSCHLGIENPLMAGAERPHAPHPGDYLKHHPINDYGCTICHRGQGAATNFFEAKAVEAHWDYPLLPPELTESSCGVCHDAGGELMQREAPKLARGQRLFVDRGCGACHKVDGVGGQLGPALDGEGLKTRHELPMANIVGEHTLANWQMQHFADPQKIVAGSQMPPPNLTREDSEALTIYMLSLQDRDLPARYLAADKVAEWNRRLNHTAVDPEALYNQYCANCHGDGTYGRWHAFYEQFTPAVRGPGLRAMADEEYVRTAIEKGRPGTIMPGWDRAGGNLAPAQVDALVTYLRAGDDRKPQTLHPAPAELSGGDPARGRALFTQNCVGCHGPAGAGGLGPALANPVFLGSASDRMIATTIVNGRADTAMPAFQREPAAGLTDAEIRDIVAWIRSLAPANEQSSKAATEAGGSDHE